MAGTEKKKVLSNVIVSKDGRSFVKRGSASDPGSEASKKKLAKKRVNKALSKVSGDLKTRVIASQKKSVERGGVQRQANEKTGDKGELSVQKDTAPKKDAIKNEPTERGIRKAFEGAAKARADAKKKRKATGTS